MSLPPLRVIGYSSSIDIELCPAYGTIFASTFNQLNDAKPMKSMITRKLPCPSHVFLANGTFLAVLLMIFTFRRWLNMILNKGIVDVYVLQLVAEEKDFLDLFVEVSR